MCPTEHVNLAWIYHQTLWYVIIHTPCQSAARPPCYYSPGLVLQAGLDLRQKWPSGTNLNRGGVNFTRDDRSWESPKERRPVQLHRACTLSSTASVHMCAELAAVPVMQSNQGEIRPFTYHHSPKSVSPLKTYRQPWPCDIPFGISILGPFEHLCQQMTPTTKALSEADCISISAFLEHQLTNKGTFCHV